MGTIRVSAEDQRHVDAYLEYHALVGATDGGRLLSFEVSRQLQALTSTRRHHLSSPSLLLRCPVSVCICKHIYVYVYIFYLYPLCRRERL